MVDLIGPIALYYGLRAAGAGIFLALIIGAAAPALNATIKLIRDHQIDGLAVGVLAIMLLSTAAALIGGSPPFLLAKDGWLTAAWGVTSQHGEEPAMSNDTNDRRAGAGRGGRMDNPDLRASDADREAVVALLRRHHLAGRLDLEEFQQRLDRSHAAKTVGELDGFVADLPRDGSDRAHTGQRPRRRRSAWRLTPLVPIFALLVAISVATGTHVFLLAIPLSFLALRGFGWCGGRWGGYHRWSTRGTDLFAIRPHPESGA